MADQISPLIQRQAEPEEEKKEPVQAKLAESTVLQRQEEEPGEKEVEEEPVQTNANPGQTPTVTTSLASRIKSLKVSGQPLPKSIRNYFEPRFGINFSKVRIHSDPKAADAAKSMNAKAFTIGNNVMFGKGQYSPETLSGKRLLIHELTHVVQQSTDTTLKIQRQPVEVPGIGPLDVCVETPLGRACGSDAKSVCEKMPSLPGCGFVCKMLGCAEKPKEESICPPGFQPARSTQYKGQCCTGTIESERSCCPRERAAWMEWRCCADDEIVSRQGRCIKSSALPPLPPICPLWWKTTTGKCCIPPLIPDGPVCVLPDKPQPPTPKPPVMPALPMEKEIFFKFDRPWPGETKSSSLVVSATGNGLANFKSLVNEMKSDSELRVQLVGRASPEGPEPYNFKLAARRAKLVKSALVDAGIADSRIVDPPGDTLDSGCKKMEPGLVNCGEAGATGDLDRQVKARVFRGV